ncbi:PREDICTED: apolipoprotein D [Dufourea novaeangliae]|uniref:Apolipoprotein D n=1 Tax=Dufourea novaeangliae TaxID=178035 RepID=A0A154PE27_DUFNO|nr:PREDICTED: apolipoprotein D [Dufourea novaeangliae]KZC09450.1 Apolipoprotein D [Dufourea novaeangliae]
MRPGTRCSRFCSLIIVLVLCIIDDTGGTWNGREDRTECPKVKAIRNFDITEFLGSWYIVQYYASSEEALSYRCMRAELSISSENTEVTMNFTYSFTDDPINEQLVGNITWKIPSSDTPAHWVHAEYPYESVYNTYVLDSDYKSWALLMHCAEQSNTPRYLSSFIMSRQPILGANVISYLREKLPRYDIDLEYMFPMDQQQCNKTTTSEMDMLIPVPVTSRKHHADRKHPLRKKHRRF